MTFEYKIKVTLPDSLVNDTDGDPARAEKYWEKELKRRLEFHDAWLPSSSCSVTVYATDDRGLSAGFGISGAVTLFEEERRRELAAVEQIHVDARGPRFDFRNQTGGKQRYARCGNCGERFPLTEDPAEDHHTAQRHHIEACKKRPQAEDERTALLDDWRKQLVETNTDEQRRQLAAAQRPRLAPAQAGKRPFWKFGWRR